MAMTSPASPEPSPQQPFAAPPAPSPSPPVPEQPFMLEQMAAPRIPKPRRIGLIMAMVVIGAVALMAASVAVTVAVTSGSGTKNAASSAATKPSDWCGPSGCFTAQPARPAAPATPAAEPNVTKAIGETFTVTSNNGDESHWTATAGRTYNVSPDGYGRPEKGTFYAIGVKVDITAGSEYVYTDDFAFVAKDGVTYGASSQTYGFRDALQGTHLNAGQKISGLVVFDVPKDAIPGARIELRPDGSGLSGGQQAFWQLAD